MKRFIAIFALALVGCSEANASTELGASTNPPCACSELEPTDIKTTDYAASHGEHVLVDFSAAFGDIEISAPASLPKTKGLKFRVSEVSADGGAGIGFALKISAVGSASIKDSVFSSNTPYIVANNGYGLSRIHASIELLDMGDGWAVIEEGCRP